MCFYIVTPESTLFLYIFLSQFAVQVRQFFLVLDKDQTAFSQNDSCLTKVYNLSISCFFTMQKPCYCYIFNYNDFVTPCMFFFSPQNRMSVIRVSSSQSLSCPLVTKEFLESTEAYIAYGYVPVLKFVLKNLQLIRQRGAAEQQISLMQSACGSEILTDGLKRIHLGKFWMFLVCQLFQPVQEAAYIPWEPSVCLCHPSAPGVLQLLF